jgi:hypothetical protein
MENTEDLSQSHWTLDEHNKVASSAKINCPSAAHGVRFFERLSNREYCSVFYVTGGTVCVNVC